MNEQNLEQEDKRNSKSSRNVKGNWKKDWTCMEIFEKRRMTALAVNYE